MAHLILPSRRVVQPQGPVEIDWANPLARGLLGAVTPFDVDAIVVGGAVPKVGMARRGASEIHHAGNGLSIVAKPVSGAWNQATILGIANNAVPGGLPFGFGTTSGGTEIFAIQIAQSIVPLRAVLRSTNGGGILTAESASTDAAANTFNATPSVWAAVWSGGVSLALYRNGVNDTAGNANTNGQASPTTLNRLCLGGLIRGTNAITQPGQNQALSLAWGRALSAAEIRAVSENPWQLFRPIQRRVWVPGADLPLNVTLAAAAVSVSSADATMTKAVPLAGAAVAGALASGGLTLTVQLAASAVSAAVATAAAAVQKSLAGAGAAQAGASAALQVTGTGTALGASALAQAGGSASLTLVLDLAAGALGRASAAASLWVQVPLSAAALDQVSASASATLVVNVRASAVAAAAAGAALRADFRLVAGAQVVAVAGAVLTVTSQFASAPPGFGFYRPAQPVFRPRSLSGGRPSMINTRRR